MINVIPHASNYCSECQAFRSLRDSVFRVRLSRTDGCCESKHTPAPSFCSRSALATHIYQIWHKNQLQMNSFCENQYGGIDVSILCRGSLESCIFPLRGSLCIYLISVMHASGRWLNVNDFVPFEILQDFVPFGFQKLCVMMISTQ